MIRFHVTSIIVTREREVERRRKKKKKKEEGRGESILRVGQPEPWAGELIEHIIDASLSIHTRAMCVRVSLVDHPQPCPTLSSFTIGNCALLFK